MEIMKEAYKEMRETITEELASSTSVESAYAILKRLPGNYVEEVVLDLVKISDNVFNALLEYARIYQQRDGVHALVKRMDTSRERIEILFRWAMERVRIGGERGTGTGIGEEPLLWSMARRGYLGRAEINELINYQNGCQKIPQDNWVAGVLAHTVMEHGQIKALIESKNTAKDWRWIGMAEQENADSEIWELMLRLSNEEWGVESIFIWGRILRHKNNKNLAEWKKRWESWAEARPGVNKGEVALMLLSTEDLREEWDIDELVRLYAKDKGSNGEVEMEGWSETSIKQIGREAMRELLSHSSKGVRLGAMKIMGRGRPTGEVESGIVKRGRNGR